MPAPLSRLKVINLIIASTLVHTIILKAAFDIYFSSPIDHGMTPIKSTENPPAKRVVFIVADGLRAERIFGKGQSTKAPHLTKIRKTRGAWGFSHTRVPTESRPGHVALLGGIYEDPAAIFLGWAGNPVDFDSVINQSTNAYCWGSPNIVRMFNKDNSPHIHSFSYDANMQDFGKNNTSSLDLWVFEKVDEFIEQELECPNCTQIEQSGNVFFLHLLGIDTAGHGYKPESLEYSNNIKIVDSFLPKIENLFETAFPDQSTAYVFTADHGMTDWGSHGSGSEDETNIPIIAWGAGIKTDSTPKQIRQIDTAPLLSALIGVNYPINSIGVLPHEFIDASPEVLSRMMINNVRQLTEIFNVKRYRRMKNAVRFTPYAGINQKLLDTKMLRLEALLQSEQHEVLLRECEALTKLLVRGADYYHNYYQLPILISITIGLAAWIIYIATYNVPIRRYYRQSSFLKFIQIFLFIPTYLNALAIINFQQLPFMYYLYFLFPIFTMQVLVKRFPHIVEAVRRMKRFGVKNTLCSFFLYIAGLRLLVQGFRDREALAVIMYFMATVVFFSPSVKRSTNKCQKITWIMCCFLLSVFPFMPVMQTGFNVLSYSLGYMLWWMALNKLVQRQLHYPWYDLEQVEVVDLQHTILKLTPIYIFCVEVGLVTPDSNFKYFAWIWAFYPILIIPCSTKHVFVRMTSVFIGFIPFYLMVTTNYEVLFLNIYVLLLYTWITIEAKCHGYDIIYQTSFDEDFVPSKHLTSNDFRRAFFFIVMIFLGFFGTGNIASLSSFDPMWVRCFLTVFSPFKMTGLILLRTMVPFIFTACAFKAVNVFRRGSALSMFCIVLVFCDLMLLELLYCITNIGPWLEIGMSLSHFVIMEMFVLMMLILYGIAYFLTTASYRIRLNHFLYYL